MLLPEYQVSSGFNPRARQRSKFHRERRKSKWLVDIPTGVIGSRNWWRRVVLFIPIRCLLVEVENLKETHLSISIDRSRERLCKPVQGDRFQNILWGQWIVDPFQELFSNPAGVSFAVYVDYALLSAAYHASRAIGLDDKTCPMVLGRVPCSVA